MKRFDLSAATQTRDLSLTEELIVWIEEHFAMQKLRDDYPHWNDIAIPADRLRLVTYNIKQAKKRYLAQLPKNPQETKGVVDAKLVALVGVNDDSLVRTCRLARFTQGYGFQYLGVADKLTVIDVRTWLQ